MLRVLNFPGADYLKCVMVMDGDRCERMAHVDVAEYFVRF